MANRLQYALFREAARIVEDGVAGPAEIDEVVRNSFGFRLPFFGPFAIADIAGLEVYQDGFTTLEAAYGERIGLPALLSDQVKRGRFGLKKGGGFYEFGNGQGAGGRPVPGQGLRRPEPAPRKSRRDHPRREPVHR